MAEEAKKELQKAESQVEMSERFTNKVMTEFKGNVAGGLQITDYQRQLIQGYFIAIDRSLTLAEEDRVRKNANNSDPKFNNNAPITWANVNLNELALDVVHYARMGLDMMQENHLFAIPFKDNKTQKYDMTLMTGYNGIKYIADKYAIDKPLAVTTEVVYSTDVFKPIKKCLANKIESYEFEVVNAFDRGEVVGAFGYIEYSDPLKNKLIVMTKKDILKRRPEHASVNFWGGKKKVWENKKQVEIDSEGWFEEMCLKTIVRAVYSAKYMPRDPKKIDDAYQYMKMREARIKEMAIHEEIMVNANQTMIDTTATKAIEGSAPQEKVQCDKTIHVDKETGEILPVALFDTASNRAVSEGPNF